MLTYIHTLNGERSEGEGGEKGCVQKKGRVREGGYVGSAECAEED